MTTDKLLKLLIACFGFMLLLWQPSVQADDGKTVGHLIVAGVGVTAQSKSGEVRSLKRRSPVYEGDVIITDKQGAQIRFTDGSLTSLRPGSRFKIEAFNWNGKEDGTEKSFFSLLKGGLRTISGAIGKKNKENYKMKTPVATIGIRGTIYQLVIRPGGKVVGVVIQGAIGIFNQQGLTVVKAGGVQHFFKINSGGDVERSKTPFEGTTGDDYGGGGDDGNDGNGNDGDDGDGNDGDDQGFGGDDGNQTPDQTTTTESVENTTYTTTRDVITRLMGSFLEYEDPQGNDGDPYNNFYIKEDGAGSGEVGGDSTFEGTFETVQDENNNDVENAFTAAKDTDPNADDDMDFKVSNKIIREHDEYEGSDFSWNWGRWGETITGNSRTGDWTVGDDAGEVDSFHFIRGVGVTTTYEIDALAANTTTKIATFGGTPVSSIATDHLGKKVDVTNVSFTANFSSREITGFSLSLGSANDESSFQPGGALTQSGGAVSFTDALGGGDSDGIPLDYGNGAYTGNATAEFLGSTAQQAMGSFSVVNSARSEGASGVYVVNKQP